MESWCLLIIKISKKVRDNRWMQPGEVRGNKDRVIGTSHGTATAKLLLSFLVIRA